MVQDIIDGIVDGLTDFFGSIGAGIIDLLINLLAFLINLVIVPIDSLISTIFPDFSNILQNFNNSLSYLISTPISFIMYHIPPITKSILLFYITILIGIYSIKYVYKGIILVFEIIQKIKFW